MPRPILPCTCIMISDVQVHVLSDKECEGSIYHAKEMFSPGNVPTQTLLLYSHNGRDLGTMYKWLYTYFSAA